MTNRATDLGEAEDKLLVTVPRHGCRGIRKPRGHKIRVMRTLVKRNDDQIMFNGNGCRHIKKITENLFGLSSLILSADPAGHEAVERGGHQRDLQIKVDLQADHRRECIQVKKLNGVRDAVFDEHPLRVPGYQGRAFDREVVGEDDRRFFMAQIGDRHLAKIALVAFEPDTLIEHLRGSERTSQRVQGDPTPCRRRAAEDLAEHFPGPASQGQEEDSFPVQFVHVLIGGQLGIEDQLRRERAGVLVPEINKAEDLSGLFRLANSRIRVAENAFCRIPGEEDQNTLLTSAAAGDVVFFERFFLAIGGNRVEVKINRRAPFEAGTLNLLEPGPHQFAVGPMVYARTVSGQIRAFRNYVEAGKQGDAVVEDQVHHVTLPFLADQLHRQKSTDRLFGGDHGRTGQINLAQNAPQVDPLHERHKQEESADPGTEGTRRQIEFLDIGDRGGFRSDRGWPLIIPASRKTLESLLAQESGQGIDADAVPGSRQFALDIIDRQVLFAHSDGQVSYPITHGGALGPMFDVRKEGVPFFGIMPKLVAEDAKGSWGVAETTGDILGGLAFDEKGTQGFVLPVEGFFGCQEEAHIGRWC
jgi:hypothetical protein